MDRFRVPVVAMICAMCCGCAAQYRHVVFHDHDVAPSTHTVDIRGTSDATQLAIVADFRYVRLLLPADFVVQQFHFTDEDGGVDEKTEIQERRAFRIDVPLLTLWNLDDGGLAYPGALAHRHSIELWLSGETQLRKKADYWADVGLVYYATDGVGVRLFGGYTSVRYRATTSPPGQEFPRLFEGRANGFGGGIELTFTAGEHALDLVKWLIGVDRRYRERERRHHQ